MLASVSYFRVVGLVLCLMPVPASAILVYQFQFGTVGNGDGQFNYPSGVAVSRGTFSLAIT